MSKKMMVVVCTAALLAACDSAAGLAVAKGEVGTGSSATPSVAVRTFFDVREHWAKDSVEKAVQKGYVDGYEDGTFRPDLSVTRAEFIKMTVQGMKLQTAAQASGDNWYTPFVNAAVSAGIHRWSDFSTGDWNTPITRQEMARIAVRATDPMLQKPEVRMDDRSFMYNATKKGLIQGLAGGELGPDKSTTRAQSVTIIERILTVNGGGKLDVDKAALSYAAVELRGSNIEEYFGTKAITLPYKIDLGGGSEMTIKKIVVVDMTNPDSAYYDMFKDATTSNDTNIHEQYVLAFDVTVTSKKSESKPQIQDMRRTVEILNWPVVLFEKRLKYFYYYKDETVDGWFAFSASKKNIDRLAFEVGAPFNPQFRVLNKTHPLTILQ